MPNRRHKGRDLNGLLLLDKPANITSNNALQEVKKIFNAAKAGHTGSLDPLATGMLIICFGRATKMSNYLLTADKYYEVVLMLGVTTDTGDADGIVLERKDASLVSEEDIYQNIKYFTGSIEQIPPMFSALKHQGKRLHQLARQGIEVGRKPRKVHIYKFKLIKRKDNLLYMHVHCSKGTYVRTLAENLGKQLGCGAHVVELRRTGIGPFVSEQLVTVKKLQSCAQQKLSLLDELLVPTDSALQAFSALSIGEELIAKMCHGNPVRVAKSPANGFVRIYDENNQFYGLGSVLEDGRIALKCLN